MKEVDDINNVFQVEAMKIATLIKVLKIYIFLKSEAGFKPVSSGIAIHRLKHLSGG